MRKREYYYASENESCPEPRGEMHLDARDRPYEITSNTKILCPKYTSRSPGMKREQGEPENLGVSDRSVLLPSPTPPPRGGAGDLCSSNRATSGSCGRRGNMRVLCAGATGFQATEIPKLACHRREVFISSQSLSFISEMKEEGDLCPSSGS